MRNSPTIQYLDLLAEMGPAGSIGQRAMRLARRQAEPVRASALEDIPEPQRSGLLALLDESPPRQGLCHDNAWRLCAYAPAGLRVDMVSGYAASIIPMEHSWVRVHAGDRAYDFDPTDWGCFKGKAFSEHVGVVSLDRDQALERAGRSGHSGPWVTDILLESLGVAPREPLRRGGKAAPKAKPKTGAKP